VIEFDEFINLINQRVARLSSRGEIVLEELSKKFSTETMMRRRIIKGKRKLTEHVDIIKKITNLSSNEFKRAKKLYFELKEMREQRNTIEIHNITDEMAKILDVDIYELQEATRDDILESSIDDIFSKNKK
jgi:hypothetical protein